jgi:hypothetical protein
MIFNKDLLDMVLSGRKTQTRRRHKNPLKEKQKYVVKRNWYKNTKTLHSDKEGLSPEAR